MILLFCDELSDWRWTAMGFLYYKEKKWAHPWAILRITLKQSELFHTWTYSLEQKGQDLMRVSLSLCVFTSLFLFSSDSTPSCQLGSISLYLSLKIQIIFSWICRQNYSCKFFVFSSLFWNYIIKSLLRKTQPWSNGKRKHHEVTAPSKTTLWVCGWGAR